MSRLKKFSSFFTLNDSNETKSTEQSTEVSSTTSTITVQVRDWYDTDSSTLTSYESICSDYLGSIDGNTSLCSRPYTAYQSAVSGVASEVSNELSNFFNDVDYVWGDSSQKSDVVSHAGQYGAKGFLAAHRASAINLAVSDEPCLPGSQIWCDSGYATGGFNSSADCKLQGLSIHHNLIMDLSTPVNHFNAGLNASPNLFLIGGAMLLATISSITSWFSRPVKTDSESEREPIPKSNPSITFDLDAKKAESDGPVLEDDGQELKKRTVRSFSC